MRNAGGQLAERGELLRLNQAILSAAEFIKRRAQIISTFA